MTSKTYILEVSVEYKVVSIEEDEPKSRFPGTARSLRVVYDRRFVGIDRFGHSNDSGFNPLNKIAEHAKTIVAEEFKIPENSLHAETWMGHRTVYVLMKQNPHPVTV